MLFGFPKSQSGSVQESFLTVLLHGMVEVEALLGGFFMSICTNILFFLLGRCVAFTLPTSWRRPSSASAGSWSPGRPLQPRPGPRGKKPGRRREKEGSNAQRATGGAELHGVGVHGPPSLQRRGAHRPGSAPGGHRALGEARIEATTKGG